jgi:pimeloyl-ACP methyl ester carboxylesterase
MADHDRRGAITRIGAVDIAWESFGDPDHPAILLIAGLGTQMIRWTGAFCRALAARGWRVIRFDNRDTGCSSHLDHCPPPDLARLIGALGAGLRPDLPYTLNDMADDAVGLLDALGIGRAHVVGRSMGGMIAQILASDHGHRVCSLTSIMSGTGNPAVAGPAPDVLALLLGPAPDPVIDPEGFLAHGLAFARRIAGTGRPFDAAACRALLLDELRRGRAPGGARPCHSRHRRPVDPARRRPRHRGRDPGGRAAPDRRHGPRSAALGRRPRGGGHRRGGIGGLTPAQAQDAPDRGWPSCWRMALSVARP